MMRDEAGRAHKLILESISGLVFSCIVRVIIISTKTTDFALGCGLKQISFNIIAYVQKYSLAPVGES